MTEIDYRALLLFAEPKKPVEFKNMHKITRFVFLGDGVGAGMLQQLKAINCGGVINCTPDDGGPYSVPNYFGSDFEYLRLPVEDKAASADQLAAFFRPAHNFICKIRKQGKTIYVHCAAGVSRPPSIVMAHLLLDGRSSTFEHAYEYVRQRRTCARPNDGFVKKLVAFEHSLKMGHSNENDSILSELV